MPVPVFAAYVNNFFYICCKTGTGIWNEYHVIHCVLPVPVLNLPWNSNSQRDKSCKLQWSSGKHQISRQKWTSGTFTKNPENSIFRFFQQLCLFCWSDLNQFGINDNKSMMKIKLSNSFFNHNQSIVALGVVMIFIWTSESAKKPVFGQKPWFLSLSSCAADPGSTLTPPCLCVPQRPLQLQQLWPQDDGDCSSVEQMTCSGKLSMTRTPRKHPIFGNSRTLVEKPVILKVHVDF